MGNEINDGFLWPVGRISTKGFSPASQLLHSSIAGAKAAGSPQIALHLANGWDWGTLRWFFNGIFIQGALDKGELNMIGVSFYPFYNAKATLASLKSALNNLIALTGKDVFVAETDWPVQCSGTSMSESSIAISAAGQMSWVAKIRDVLSSLSGGHGIGICACTLSRTLCRVLTGCAVYWEPAWIGNAGLGSSCAVRICMPYPRRGLLTISHRTTLLWSTPVRHARPSTSSRTCRNAGLHACPLCTTNCKTMPFYPLGR